MAEKYTLNWHTYTDHLQLMFKDLYEEDKHSDVTLVSDDQTQFKAHKIVLRACSPVFKKIIDNNPSQHPLIYLRGIQSYEMESILQFMYLGEAKLNYERMGEFIKVAKDLEVKEISMGVEIPKVPKVVTEETVRMDDEEKETDDEHDEPKHESENKIMQKQSRNQISGDDSECPECGKKFSQRSHMLAHYRSLHEVFKFSCNQCDYQASQNGHLKRHIQSKHEGIKYLCPQCDYKTSYQPQLHTHIRSKHEGVRYPCPKCEALFVRNEHMIRHYRSKHEGIKYPCEECDYQATTHYSLKTHIQSKHEGIKYPCDQCDYQARWKSDLTTHKKARHMAHIKSEVIV